MDSLTENRNCEIMENNLMGHNQNTNGNRNQNRIPTSSIKSEIADESKHDSKRNHHHSKSEVKQKYILFFGKESPFSQHHLAKFEIDGITFNCAEQYMMYMKAVTFHDEKMKQSILKATSPVIQKRLGRKVKNFDVKIWREKARNIVKRATEEKFSQNPHLKKILLETYPKHFVECNPRDRIWGIGLSQKAPEARDRSKWKGKNLLGEIITEVRNKLYEEEQSLKDKKQ